MHIENAKLPRGMSYPLKTAFLAETLRTAQIELDTSLVRGTSGALFEAHFWPPNPDVGYERLFLRACAVAAADSSKARAYLETSVVPEFIAWVRAILSAPMNSPARRDQQYFVRKFSARDDAPKS